MMPIGDPPDGFFYPTLILMMDSYNRTATFSEEIRLTDKTLRCTKIHDLGLFSLREISSLHLD